MSFVRAASLRVNNWLFTPGQFVTRTGDLAHELYYIKRGEVWTLTRGRRIQDFKLEGGGVKWGRSGGRKYPLGSRGKAGR